MAKKLGYYGSVLKEAGGQGWPVEDLIPKVESLQEEAERLWAVASGKKIYRIVRDYQRIVADDEVSASHEADTLGGCFAQEKVELAEDPSEGLSGRRVMGPTEPTEA